MKTTSASMLAMAAVSFVMMSATGLVARGNAPAGMVLIPAGTFTVGSDAPESRHNERPTHKVQGYATGQFGKNHLGDLNQYLPTVHGFDEFFGNLYHLNAEEEPERPYWPKDPNDPFVKGATPRGVMHCFATDTDDPTVEDHWGKVGKQKIEDTGPLTAKRMETIDDETTGAAIDFMSKHPRASASTRFARAWMSRSRRLRKRIRVCRAT